MKHNFDGLAKDISSIVENGNPLGLNLRHNEVVLRGKRADDALYLLKDYLHDSKKFVNFLKDFQNSMLHNENYVFVLDNDSLNNLVLSGKESEFYEKLDALQKVRKEKNGCKLVVLDKNGGYDDGLTMPYVALVDRPLQNNSLYAERQLDEILDYLNS